MPATTKPAATEPVAPAPVPADLGVDLGVDPELIGRLRLAVLRLSRRLRQNAAAGITASQLSVLTTLARHEALTLGELAAHEGVQPPSVTRMVDNLERAGLVARGASPTDRRTVMARLTPKGRKAVEDIRRRRDAWLAQRLGELDAGTRGMILAALPALEALAADPGAKP